MLKGREWELVAENIVQFITRENIITITFLVVLRKIYNNIQKEYLHEN